MEEKDPFPEKMQKLQQMRVAMVLLLSEGSSKLLSLRQRASGKEIEVMCAERDHARDAQTSKVLKQVYSEDRIAKDALAVAEAEFIDMERVLAKIDADIGAMCQS